MGFLSRPAVGAERLAGGTYYSSPVSGDGKIYTTSLEGKVSVIKAGAQWEVLAVNTLDDECIATPAIVEDRISIRTRSRRYCFAKR
jgi:outer membrane protein assembly factor BamB